MNKLTKFKNQVLTPKQAKLIIGGYLYKCTFSNGRSTLFTGTSSTDIADQADAYTEDNGYGYPYNCSKVNTIK